VRELGPPPRLEVGEQVKLAFVIGAVTAFAQRDDARGVVAATHRFWDDVGRVRVAIRTADDARASADSVALCDARFERR
jgi:hypothetical protein